MYFIGCSVKRSRLRCGDDFKQNSNNNNKKHVKRIQTYMKMREKNKSIKIERA